MVTAGERIEAVVRGARSDADEHKDCEERNEPSTLTERGLAAQSPQRLRSLSEMIAHTWRTSLIRLLFRADSISSAAIEIESRERIACCSFLALSRYR